MFLHISAMFVLILCALVCAADNADDFDDPDLSLPKLRIERSGDYIIGGPLAGKCPAGKRGKFCNETIPPVDTPRSLQPTDYGVGPPLEKCPPGRTGANCNDTIHHPVDHIMPVYDVGPPQVKECGGQTGRICPNISTTAAPAAASSKSGTTASAPVSKRNCPFMVYANQVLTGILWGAANASDYELKATNSCRLISDCAELCDSVSCNYFMRSNNNGLAKFYVIKSEKLDRNRFSKSDTFDSYFPRKEECF